MGVCPPKRAAGQRSSVPSLGLVRRGHPLTEELDKDLVTRSNETLDTAKQPSPGAGARAALETIGSRFGPL